MTDPSAPGAVPVRDPARSGARPGPRAEEPQAADSHLYHRPHYQPGIPAVIEVPDTPVSELLETAAAFYPHRVALDFLGATLTYAELLEACERAAWVLREAGVRHGDRVALLMPNCPQHVVAIYGALRLGAVVAEHNPLAPAEEIRSQLAGNGARVLVAWEKSVEGLLGPADGTSAGPGGAAAGPEGAGGPEGPRGPVAARRRAPDSGLPQGLTVLSVDLSAAMPWRLRAALRLPVARARRTRASMRAGHLPTGVRSWDRETARAQRLPASWPRPGPGDVAVLLYTGGTTGTPKAAMLTHANLRANANQAIAWVPMLHEGAETFLALLPFFHAFGLTFNVLCAVQKAATQVLLPRFDVDQALAAHRRRPFSFLVGVPVMFARILEGAERAGVSLRTLRYGVCGAAPMPREVGQRWEEATGGFLVEGYGMTETSPIVSGTPMGAQRRLGSLGLPFASTDVRVVDPEDPDPSREVPDGQPGELLVRGPQVFAGYWEDPQATADVMLEGGWLRTGDMVRREDSFLWMADRRRELILTGGFNVYPSQVEEALRSLDAVADVAVVGLPDSTGQEAGGEVVAAVVVLEPGHQVTLEGLRAHAEKVLPRYALPRRLEVVEKLPRSAIGKVLRREARRLLLEAGT